MSVNTVCGAIHLDRFGDSEPPKKTLESVIHVIMNMYPDNIRTDIRYIYIYGTKYGIYANNANPILYRINKNNGSTRRCINTPEGCENSVIGTIMMSGCKIPDISKYIVWHICPGIYGIGRWITIRKDLLDATGFQYLTWAKFFANVSDVLKKRIGYISSPTMMNSLTQSPSEIMGALTLLFYKKEVVHATEHMEKIFKLMNQLCSAVN